MQSNDTANQKQATKRHAATKMAKTEIKDEDRDGGTVVNPCRLYTTDDLMSLFGKSRRTIIRWRKECGLPMSYDARGTITGRKLLKWLDQRRN